MATSGLTSINDVLSMSIAALNVNPFQLTEQEIAEARKRDAESCECCGRAYQESESK